MKDERLSLSNIRDCIDRIEAYTASGQEEFLKNIMAQDAVIRNFEIIGEATKQLSSELKTQYPDVQWRQIAGLRDVLIHDYLKVDLQEVWMIVEENLPELKQKVELILQGL